MRADQDIVSPSDTPEPLPIQKLCDGPAEAGALFLLPGTGGEGHELALLAAYLTAPGAIFALSYLPPPAVAARDALVWQARAAIAAMRRAQPQGPWQLIGYSFGALVAAEAARQLGRAGTPVPDPILIDAYYDARFWPAGAWAMGQLRRAGHHLARIAQMPPGAALSELRYRTGRLSGKLGARLGRPASASPALNTVPSPGPAQQATSDIHLAALRAYDPGFYPGGLILLGADDPVHFGCRAEDLWHGRSDRLQVDRLPGNHLDLLRNPAALADLAAAVGRHLSPPPQSPLVLLVASFPWPATADLAAALQAAGFAVAGFAKRRHPMRRLPGLTLHPMPLLHRERALGNVVARHQPQLILPCDEFALELVRGLSDGRPDIWPTPSRAGSIAHARAAGMRAPVTEPVASAAALTAWIGAQGLPVVLKTDGSWGGRGVGIARTAAEAERLRRRLARGPGLIRALKWLVVNAEPQLIRALWRGVPPVVNVQAHVAGRDANIALAVWQGRVLASIAAEVLEVSAPLGPAKVIRVIDQPEMLATASAVMRAIGMTGLAGMDFLIDAEGAAHLIEVNARATPTCGLQLGPGRDPVGALRAMFPGAAPVPLATEEVIGRIIDLSDPGAPQQPPPYALPLAAVAPS